MSSCPFPTTLIGTGKTNDAEFISHSEERLVPFKIYALSVLTFIGSVAESTQFQQRVRILRFKCFRLGPFILLRRGSILSAGMARIRAAKDHDGRTLDSCARSWGDLNLHSSTAHFTTTFLVVNAMDILRSLRSLPFQKMQTGAALMIRQSGSILGSLPLLAVAQIVHWFCQPPSRSCSSEGFLSGCQFL